MPVGRGDGVNNFPPAVPSTTPTHWHFVLSQVRSLVSGDQDGGLSYSTIYICDLAVDLDLTVDLLNTNRAAAQKRPK